MNLDRWNALLRELGTPRETKTFSRLQSAYAEGHRGTTPRDISTNASRYLRN